MYPEEIDLPEAEDFCKGILRKGSRCCFIGWRLALLPDLTESQNDRFSTVARSVANEMALKRNEYYWGMALSDINDHKGNTREQLAEWFARTIKKLGYDIS